MLVEMSRLAFHFEARRGLTEAERDHLKNYLYGRVSGQVNVTRLREFLATRLTEPSFVCRSGESCGA